jgi:hypothetical protein
MRYHAILICSRGKYWLADICLSIVAGAERTSRANMTKNKQAHLQAEARARGAPHHHRSILILRKGHCILIFYMFSIRHHFNDC